MDENEQSASENSSAGEDAAQAAIKQARRDANSTAPSAAARGADTAATGVTQLASWDDYLYRMLVGAGVLFVLWVLGQGIWSAGHGHMAAGDVQGSAPLVATSGQGGYRGAAPGQWAPPGESAGNRNVKAMPYPGTMYSGRVPMYPYTPPPLGYYGMPAYPMYRVPAYVGYPPPGYGYRRAYPMYRYVYYPPRYPPYPPSSFSPVPRR